MAHHNLLELLPRVDLDLFFGIVKFSNLGFYMKNVTVMDSLENCAAFGPEIGGYSKGVNEGI